MSDKKSDPLGQSDQGLSSAENFGISVDREDFSTLACLLDPPFGDKFLPDDPVPHAALAIEIANHGIYKFKKGKLEYCPQNSSGAEEALIAISLNLKHQHNPPSPDFETWYLENDMTYSYGWPTQFLPRFRPYADEHHWIEAFSELQTRGSFFRKKLQSLSQLLLTNAATTAGITCAMDSIGIFHENQVGLIEHIKNDPYIRRDITDALGTYKKSLSDTYGRSIDLNALQNPFLMNFGWIPKQLPDFDALEKEYEMRVLSSINSSTESTSVDTAVDTPERNIQLTSGSRDKELEGKAKTSYDHVLCALILLIGGKLGELQLPIEEKTLRKYLHDTFRHTPGMSENYLRRVFQEALGCSGSFGVPVSTDEANDKDNDSPRARGNRPLV